MTTFTVLTMVWTVILASIVIMYVILDGFDLGVGILFPLVPDASHRDVMMNSIAPVWDGNETWLVFGGAVLFGVFPLAYGTLLPSLYIPLLLMVIALIFRGVSFEFRFKAHKSRFIWNYAFFGGSIIAAFLQGAVLGTIVQGFVIDEAGLISTNTPWLTPFSIMTGIAVVTGYALLGATWTIIKSTGELQQKMYRYAKRLLIGVTLFMIAVSIWTPFIDPEIMQRWFKRPDVFFLAILPLITIIAVIYAGYTLYRQHEKSPFVMSILIFLCGYAGFGISIWPYIIPRAITIWEAAAPVSTQIFVLVGAGILIPILIAYTIYSYSVFKGKVHPETRYH